MANDELLAQYAHMDVEQFFLDFAELVRVAFEIDKQYGKAEDGIGKYIKKFKPLLKDFNKKYSGVELEFIEKTEAVQLKIYLKENSIKDFFASSASKIKGIVSIGLEGFNEVSVNDAEKFAEAIGSIGNSLFISYSDVDLGTSNVAVFYNENKKAIEILADYKELLGKNSANSKIIAFYALKNGVERDIELHEKLMSFGFLKIPTEEEKMGYYEKFQPRFLE